MAAGRAGSREAMGSTGERHSGGTENGFRVCQYEAASDPVGSSDDGQRAQAVTVSSGGQCLQASTGSWLLGPLSRNLLGPAP